MFHSTTLGEFLTFLKNAKTPEDVFGMSATPDDVKATFRKFSKQFHPDHQDAAHNKMATEAQVLLNGFWAQANDRISQGIYGTQKPSSVPKIDSSAPVIFSTTKRVYTVLDCIHDGGTCGVFRGIAKNKKGVEDHVLIRAPHSAEDNDLMIREATAFSFMKKKFDSLPNDAAKETVRPLLYRVPSLLESLDITEPGSVNAKKVNTFSIDPAYRVGWYTLEDIRKAYPQGVDPRIATFMMNRVIEALMFVHSARITHNAITPNHVLIHAETHMGQLIDWTASTVVGSGEKIPYRDDRYQDFFPEEIKSGQCPSERSDIYMASWCMIYVLGGDPHKRYVPDSVPKPLVEFFNKCLQPKPSLRPYAVDALYEEFKTITKALWGPRKFMEFVMPKA